MLSRVIIGAAGGSGIPMVPPGKSRPVPEKYRKFNGLPVIGGGIPCLAAGAAHRRCKCALDKFTRDSNSYRA